MLPKFLNKVFAILLKGSTLFYQGWMGNVALQLMIIGTLLDTMDYPHAKLTDCANYLAQTGHNISYSEQTIFSFRITKHFRGDLNPNVEREERSSLITTRPQHVLNNKKRCILTFTTFENLLVILIELSNFVIRLIIFMLLYCGYN